MNDRKVHVVSNVWSAAHRSTDLLFMLNFELRYRSVGYGR